MPRKTDPRYLKQAAKCALYYCLSEKALWDKDGGDQTHDHKEWELLPSQQLPSIKVNYNFVEKNVD